MSEKKPLQLVADIGGTHIRLGLVRSCEPLSESSIELIHFSKERCRDFRSPIDAIKKFLNSNNDCQINAMCLAVAGPVTEGRVELINHDWIFEANDFKNVFGLNRIQIVNDFHAQAMAIPYLKKNDLVPIGNNPSQEVCKNSPSLIIGPGTGLGTASLVKIGEQWHVFDAEGGHIDFAPRSERDEQVKVYLKDQENFSRVTTEHLLCGRGIEWLYKAHRWVKNLPFHQKKDRDIIQDALQHNDFFCIEVLEHFCEILGGVAGNAALSIGARQGVYIAGGLIPRFIDLFGGSAFRKAFEDKAPLVNYMKNIPVYAVVAEHPGLLGAAALLR